MEKRKGLFFIMIAAVLLALLCFAAPAFAYDENNPIAPEDYASALKDVTFEQTSYADNTEIEPSFEVKRSEYAGSESVDVKGGFLVLQDDVTLIRESTGDGITVSGSGNSVSLNSYTTGRNSSLAAGKKVLIVETDGSVRCFVSGGFSGGTLLIDSDSSAGKNAFSYMKAFDISEADGEIKLPIRLKKKKSQVEMEIEGDLILKGTGSGKIYWDGFGVNFSFSVELDFKSIQVKIETKDHNLMNIPLGHFEVPVVPEVFGIDLTPNFFVESKASGTVGFQVDITEGFQIDVVARLFHESHINSSRISDGPDADLLGLEIAGEVYAGLGWGPKIELLEGLVAFGGEYKAGVVVEGKLKAGHFDPDDGDRLKWHACEDLKCFQGDVHPRLGPLAVELEVLKKPFTLVETLDPIELPQFAEFYHSFTYNDGSYTMGCPHYGYKLIVDVTDREGNRLSDAVVSYAPYEQRFKEVASDVKPDKKGQWLLYIPLGNPSSVIDKNGHKVTVTASMKDPMDPSVTLTSTAEVTEKGKNNKGKVVPEKLTLVIDMRKATVYFRDTGEGSAKNMPAPISFRPAGTKGVNIPDAVPEKSGRHFMGWNTEEDGSGSMYAPGSFFPATADCTLYAQWEVIYDSYAILYNANGGTSAPNPQVVPLRQSAVLTEEAAVWEGMNFLGWAYDDTAFEPDFPAGQKNILKNADDQPLITLYAVWGFNPVSMPICISFDMNAGPVDQMPSEQWIRPGSALTVTNDIPVRENYDFLGWSLDPLGAEAMYFPGRSYHFFEDTVLYAVWYQTPVTSPVHITFDLNGAPEGEKPEDVWVKPGNLFTLSEITPEWDEGHLFRGWSVYPWAKDGEYHPGKAASFSEDTVLYAVWHELQRCEVRFVDTGSGGALEMPDTIYFYPETTPTVQLPDDVPEKTGRIFTGWNTAGDGSGTMYSPGAAVTPGGNLILYAQWKQVTDSYVIIYNANGGSRAPLAQIVPMGQDAVLTEEAALREGDTFLGWDRDGSAISPTYPAGQKNVLKNPDNESPIILYAIWDNTYSTISFDLAGGEMNGRSGIITETAKTGSIITIPGPPTRKGYDFLYWEGSRYNPGDRYTVTEDHTLTAVWAKKVPATGDRADIALWVGFIITGVLAVCGLSGYARKKR